jgi:hypothetical protein
MKNSDQEVNLVKALYLILLLEFINIFYYFYFLSSYGYLPAPFAFDKNDTLMDFYNPLFWAIKDGFYTTFKSLYPALNYLFLKIFALGFPSDKISNPFQLRNDFPIFGIIISFIYVFIIFVVVNIGRWRKPYISHKGLIFLACALSVPVLFGLERGNLIFLALLFLALYLNASNPWIKAIFLGLLVNVKPYFIILFIQYLNIHQFNKVEFIRSILIASAIFFFLGLLAGLNFIDFFKNYIKFSESTSLSAEGVVALPHSIAALSTIKALINFGDGSKYTFWFSILKLINYTLIVILIFYALVKKLTPLELLVASIIIITNFSINTGGYILIVYIILIPYLFEIKEYKKILILIILIYAFPLDFIKFMEISFNNSESYLTGKSILIEEIYFISIGSIVRPLFNFLILVIFLKFILRKYTKIFKIV